MYNILFISLPSSCYSDLLLLTLMPYSDYSSCISASSYSSSSACSFFSSSSSSSQYSSHLRMCMLIYENSIVAVVFAFNILAYLLLYQFSFLKR